MNVLVSGGAGFIGSHLVDALLSDDHNVIVIDNFSTGRRTNLDHVAQSIKIIEADLSEKNGWEANLSGIDWVFHLAALADIVPSIQNPDAYFKSNVVGTSNLVQAAVQYNVKRFVYAASSSCYGTPNTYPTPEDAPLDPQYPYALTKRLGEELVMHWETVYKLPALSLRFFNVYGPRSRTSGTYGAMFGVFLAQKLAGKPLTVVGNGEQTRDFTYVTDVVSAIIDATKSNKTGHIYNVGSGNTVSVNKVAKLIGGDTVHIPERPGEPRCTHADISKIINEVGWAPSVTIEEGVAKVLSEIEYWGKAPVWTPESISKATKDWFKYLGHNSNV